MKTKKGNSHLKVVTLEDEFSPKGCLNQAIISPELHEDIKKHWKDGSTAEHIAHIYGLETEQVKRYVDKEFVDKHRSRYQRLTRVFDRLYEAVDLAHEAYMSDPTQGNSFSYTSLANSLRGALVDLESLQNDADLAADIVKFVLNPLIRALTQSIIEEFGSVKDELLMHYSQEDANRLVSDITKRVATHFGKGLTAATDKLESVLNARESARKKVLSGGKKKKGKKESSRNAKKRNPRSAKCDF